MSKDSYFLNDAYKFLKDSYGLLSKSNTLNVSLSSYGISLLLSKDSINYLSKVTFLSLSEFIIKDINNS